MKKVLGVACALLFVGSFAARADNADDCWQNRLTLQKAVAGGKGSDALFFELKEAWDSNPTLQRSMKNFNPIKNSGRAPTFAEALSAAVQRVCLLNYYPQNLEKGFDKCVEWCPGNGYANREDEVCGANYPANAK